MVSGTKAKIIVCRGVWDPRACEKENTDIALNWKSYFSDAGGYSFENISYMYAEMCLLFFTCSKKHLARTLCDTGLLERKSKIQ